MAEFEDVLTNQPVVIDNVGGSLWPHSPLMSDVGAVSRDQELSKQVLQAKTIRNVSFRLCASPWLGGFVPPGSSD